MSKTNIAFNNKNYSIDDSSLSAASAALRSHLQTTMSGSGATIVLDGVSYNVDSVKLYAAKDDFISHLSTIAGSGYRVVVGGVEYFVDSAKVQDDIVEIEEYLGELKNGDTEQIVINLLSFDNYILQDVNGLYLIAKESN